VDRIYAMLPEASALIPPTILDLGAVGPHHHDPRQHPRHAVTLLATIVLVTAGGVPIPAPRCGDPPRASTVPLALAAPCAAMWFAGFSIRQHLADGARVSVASWSTTPSSYRKRLPQSGKGHDAVRATIEGRARSASTVSDQHSVGRGLFTPLLYGRAGRPVFSEFSVTLTFAIGSRPWCRCAH